MKSETYPSGISYQKLVEFCDRFDLILWDKDGTLTKPASGDKFPQGAIDQEFYDLRLIPIVGTLLGKDDKHMGIITNQGGVGDGYKTEEEAIDETLYAMSLTGIRWAALCPDSPKRPDTDPSVGIFLNDTNAIRAEWPYLEAYRTRIRCNELKSNVVDYRKPGSGMIRAAMNYFQIEDPKRILFVGNHHTDKSAAIAQNIYYMDIDNLLKSVSVTETEAEAETEPETDSEGFLEPGAGIGNYIYSKIVFVIMLGLVGLAIASLVSGLNGLFGGPPTAEVEPVPAAPPQVPANKITPNVVPVVPEAPNE